VEPHVGREPGLADIVGSRGQHYDGDPALFAPQRPNDVVAVNTRQTNVEHEQISSGACTSQRRVPIGSAGDCEPFTLKMMRQ
jgi:hypothetical protein